MFGEEVKNIHAFLNMVLYTARDVSRIVKYIGTLIC